MPTTQYQRIACTRSLQFDILTSTHFYRLLEENCIVHKATDGYLVLHKNFKSYYLYKLLHRCKNIILSLLEREREILFRILECSHTI